MPPQAIRHLRELIEYPIPEDIEFISGCPDIGLKRQHNLMFEGIGRVEIERRQIDTVNVARIYCGVCPDGDRKLRGQRIPDGRKYGHIESAFYFAYGIRGSDIDIEQHFQNVENVPLIREIAVHRRARGMGGISGTYSCRIGGTIEGIVSMNVGLLGVRTYAQERRTDNEVADAMHLHAGRDRRDSRQPASRGLRRRRAQNTVPFCTS